MKKNIKSLTGIRGIAAVLVVFYHLLHHSVSITFLQNGYLSVDLFFILSGFIMMYVHKSDFEEGVTVNKYVSFIGSRIVRVWPAYILWLSLNIILLFKHNNAPSMIQTFANFFMIQNWMLSKSIVGTGWSLSVEFFVYFFFPIICFIFSRGRKNILITLAICLSSIVFISIYKIKFITGTQDSFSGPMDLISYDGTGALIRGLSEFSLGVSSFFVFRYMSSKDRISNITCFLSLVAIIVSMLNKSYDILFIVSSFFLIPSLASSSNLITKIIGSRVPFFLGKISYSLYLCHIPLAYSLYSFFSKHISSDYFSDSVTKLLLSCLTLSFCIAIAWASYLISEKRSFIKYLTIKPKNIA